MEGAIQPIISALQKADLEARLASLSAGAGAAP
jgi:hypothetical protein